MKYYIAAEGGGTKLIIILYDENMQIIRSLKSGGINESFKSISIIKKELRSIVRALFKGLSIMEIEEITYSLASWSEVLFELIEKYVKIKARVKFNEGYTVLAATGLNYGIVAQAGTGSDVFVIQPNHKEIIGGLGAVLGDEGGGYNIGVNGLKAAIKSYYNIGEKTILQKYLFEAFEVSEPRELAKKLVKEPLLREKIANLTYLISKACLSGDKVATEIYNRAGHDMAEQVICALKLIGGKVEGDIIASGGAWKGVPYMLEVFKSDIHRQYPEISIRYPIFEPIIGCIILSSLNTGKNYADIEPILKKEYEKFIYTDKKN